ncbi:MAG TPA: aminopeptidase N [Mycobacteriales bacterium]|nr:aminopeptidase N [Mycobacteriales bacterium]
MTAENLTLVEAEERRRLLDVALYDVQLDLTTALSEPRRFRSTTSVTFSCIEPGATAHLDITADLVESATLNGTPIDVERAFNGQRLMLPPLAAANELTVVAQCVYSRSGEGLHRFVDPVDGEVYLYTQFETFDAHRMFACFDQPDLKAVFRIMADAPDHWRVLSNMPSSVEGGRHMFEPTPRQSTYITALVAGPYEGTTATHDGIDLGVYCRRSLLEHLDAGDILEVTRQGFDAFHALFETRYAWPKYDQVFVPEFNMGAMENAGCVTFTEDYIFRSRTTDYSYERRAVTVLHEMAHMWFGDLVTMKWWDDLWLNESFAEFVSTHVTAGHTRWPDVWTSFCNAEKTWAYRQDQLATTHPIAADIPDIEAVTTNFDGITYAKGASVLKLLAHWVGEDAFFSATRSYFAKHAHSNTTMQDLLDALEAASGRDLSAWTQQWIQTAGVNTLRAEFETDAEDCFTSFAVRQTAPAEHPTLRMHRLRIGLYDEGADGLRRQRQLEIDVAGERTEVPDLIGVERPDLVLLNDDDLTYAKIRLDDRSWHTLVTSIGRLTDPLARTLCWTAAWDMTRDAEVSAGDYLDLVIAGVGQETEVGTVQTLLRLAAQAIDPYGDPARSTERRTRLAARAFELLDANPPGSDLQLAFTRAAAANATSPDQLDRVAALLEGKEQVDGLVVDTELRWLLLHRLVATGRADDARIDAELARDDTSAGRCHALTLRAARPSAAAKAEAWRQVVEHEELPNAEQEATIAGFVSYEQRDLLEPYVDAYFGAIGELYRTRSAEMAQQLIAGLYPYWATDVSTIEHTEAYLAAEEPGAALRRMLLEGRDALARALRSRERDMAAATRPLLDAPSST